MISGPIPSPGSVTILCAISSGDVYYKRGQPGRMLPQPGRGYSRLAAGQIFEHVVERDKREHLVQVTVPDLVWS